MRSFSELLILGLALGGQIFGFFPIFLKMGGHSCIFSHYHNSFVLISHCLFSCSEKRRRAEGTVLDR